MPGPTLETSEAFAIPDYVSVSGTYVSSSLSKDSIVALNDYEEVRLDVDGTFPQLMASGTYYPAGLLQLAPKSTHWIAYPMRRVRDDTWEGPILRRWGAADVIPHEKVRIHVPRTTMIALSTPMTITFFGGPPSVSRTLKFVSPWFREVIFEFDVVDDVKVSSRVAAINTCALSDKPVFLNCETLHFDEVYDRAGVHVLHSLRRSTAPITAAGEDREWSDTELNDAMHTYWSSYSDAPAWAVWLLFAGRHEKEKDGSRPFGKMFDQTDKNQRQGVAVFTHQIEDAVNSARNLALLGVTAGLQLAENLARNIFFAAIHEIGHCFNLHHAWQEYDKDLEWPWPDHLKNVPTIMNYPNEVLDFWRNFYYRFHDHELRWLRHAPENFVKMGGEAFRPGWIDRTDTYPAPPIPDPWKDHPWELDVSLPRTRGVFEFLEPITLAVTLTNTSSHPQIVDEAILKDSENFAVVIVPHEGRPRYWRPFSKCCFLPVPRVLQPGESLTSSFFISAGLDGWYLAEPGAYTLQAMLQVQDSWVTADSLHLRIAHPCSWDEEVIAQDFFTRDVGRALAFGGTHSMTRVLDTLRETMERLQERAVSRHAALALAQPWMRDHRVLGTPPGPDGGGRFGMVHANHEEARRLFRWALLDDPHAAANSLGNEVHRNHVERYAAWLERNGGAAEATKVLAQIGEKAK